MSTHNVYYGKLNMDPSGMRRSDGPYMPIVI